MSATTVLDLDVPPGWTLPTRLCTWRRDPDMLYLQGRGSHADEPKAHGVFLSDDGGRMRTWCRSGPLWYHDNWYGPLPTGYWDSQDFCLHCLAKIGRFDH